MIAKEHDKVNSTIQLTYVITDLDIGGVPLHLYRLACRLPADRFRVRVISLADEGPVGAMLRRSGIPVSTCNAHGLADVRVFWRLYRLLRKNPPDILHAFLFHANIASRLVGLLAGLSTKQILCEIQTVEKERRWHLVVDNLTCRLCRCEIGNSRSVVNHLHKQAHIPKSRLHCQPGAVDVEAFTSATPISRAKLGLPTDEPMVIWTGRLDPVKGFEEMLAAFARVCADQPARLVLVGGGPYQPVVERLILENGLSGRVLLLGKRNDIPALLKAADAFLFCSHTEGLPNALLEAMATGLPIVATDIPGCRDLIFHQRTGLLVPAGSVEDIADGLKKVLHNPQKSRLLGAQAKAWVEKHMNIQKWTNRWIKFYTEIRKTIA